MNSGACCYLAQQQVERYVSGWESANPLLSRRLATALADVATLGRGRSTRYGLYRRIRELPPEQPVYRVSRTGESTLIGSVLTLAPDQYWYGDREYLSLPWFLTDMRPQGYLGRLFPHTYSDLSLPDRINDWNEDQALYANARPTPSLGERPVHRLPVNNRNSQCWCNRQAPSGARWSDLLLAEHLAAVVLAEHGHASAETEFLCDGQRAYLEVSRFDRTGTRGRLGLVSLGALDDEFVGERRSWSESAAALLRARLISTDAARELRFVSAFGALIGNTDMHLGNASFLVLGPMQFELAPSYDMLPMFYAPVRDEVPDRVFTPPAPAAAHADQWHAARTVAAVFWQRLAADTRASTPFRTLAARHAQAS
jgi:hypothetical protein